MLLQLASHNLHLNVENLVTENLQLVTKKTLIYNCRTLFDGMKID
jgi:hypothetical protein